MEDTSKREIFSAAKKGDKDKVEELLDAGVDVNIKDKAGWTLLHHATDSYSDSTVRFLLSRRASTLSATGDSGRIPLHLACAKAAGNPATTEIVKALVRTAGKEAKLAMDKNGETALIVAINSGNIHTVKELLASGQADQQVKAIGKNGDTVLHISVKRKDIDTTKLLIQHGAELDAQNDDGLTAAHIAAREGDEHMFKVLHALKAKVDIPDREDRTPLYFATMKGATGIIEFLIDKIKADVYTRSKNGNTLLHLSCANGHVEATLLLLKKGVLPQMPNKEGSLCIHNAARNGHVGVVKALLDKGVPVDIKNKNNLSALHEAVMSRKHGVVQLLLGYGANKELNGGREFESPIHMAARVRDGEKVADILIRSGANPDTKNEKNGERALHVAARNGNVGVVELLLTENVEVARRSSNGESPLHQACGNGHYEIAKQIVAKLFRDKSFPFAKLVVNIPNDRGETALHHLCQRVRRKETVDDLVSMAMLLLEHGANMTMKTKVRKETPLHWIARSGNYDVLKAMLTSTKVPLHLIQSGINSKTDIGASPLMIASHHGNLEVVKVFLEHGARVDVFDETGSTALHHAATYGHEEVASILMDHKSFANGRTKIGITPLHLASERGYVGLVKILITKYNALVDPATMGKKTPLHMGADSGYADICSLLLSLRADAKCSDAKGMIPVHYAAIKDHEEVVSIFYKGRPETLTQPNDDGLTVMLLAAKSGSIKVIKKLVALNFSGCATEKSVLSRPLLIAARAGHTEVVEFLLRSGASATEEDKDGMSVMLLGAKFGQMKVVDMLWGKVSIDRPSSKTGLTPVHVASLYGQTEVLQEILSRAPQSCSFVSSPPAELDENVDHGFTPLHLASQNGDPALIRMLMNSPGVRVDAKTIGMERTPLQYAAQEGHIEVVSTLISKTVAPIHMRDSLGQIPLHMAAANGYKELVTLLIGQGSDINSEDEEGNTPVHLSALGGFVGVTMLLTEYGASTVSTTKAGKSAICLAANRRHLDVVNFLLGQKLDHDKLITDKAFLLDLVNCARKLDQKPLKAFVLTAAAPVHISSLLAHILNSESRKNKEYQTVLSEASQVCETMSNHLITVSCADDSESVLNAVDGKNTAFLDFLITYDQKECVSHAVVQQYVTEIWYGDLKWQDWKFLILFLIAFFFPPIWIYLCLPFKNRYHYIPIMKFICRLISHLYMIILFIFTTVIPWQISVNNLMPPVFEWLLLVWVVGLLLSELTSSRERRGLGWIPAIVIVMTFCGVILHLVAIAVDANGTRKNLIYARNQLLAFGMIMCVVQLLEYLSIHRLFGPWGVIIGHLVADVLRFLVIMFLFLIGFALQLAAVFKPLSDVDKGYSIRDVTLGMSSISEMLFFALFGLTSQKDVTSPDPLYPSATVPLAKAVFGVYNVLCMIVLINLLIAMMSDTYQRIQTRSDVEWKFGRAKLIRTMEIEVSQPVPINLFTFLINLIQALYKARCNCRRNIIGMMAVEEEQRKAHQKKKHTRKGSRQENGLLTMKLENSEMAEHSNDLRIQNVVDWNVMIDKYFDITGEKPMDNRGKKTSKSNAKAGSGMLALQATGQALQRLNVINAMKM